MQNILHFSVCKTEKTVIVTSFHGNMEMLVLFVFVSFCNFEVAMLFGCLCFLFCRVQNTIYVYKLNVHDVTCNNDASLCLQRDLFNLFLIHVALNSTSKQHHQFVR